MVTPRRPDPGSHGGGDGSSGSGGSRGRYRIVYKDGQAVEGGENESMMAGGKAVSNWHGGNMDPDSVAKHSAQLTRMGFKNNSHAKGFF